MQYSFNYEYLSAKASVDYTDKKGETKSFDVNLRVRKDSAIWVNITPLLGIEVARVLIRKDSIMVLDRVNKVCMRRSFDFLEEMFKSKISFEILQALIVGNYFPYQKSEKIKSLYEEDPYVILSTLNKRQTKRIQEEKDPTKPIIQDFWIDGNYRIVKSRITDEKVDRWLEASYKNFREVSGYLFPGNMVMTISGSSPTIMSIAYSKVSTGEALSMPFTVPEKYEMK
ncbi:MAG: DUF4292 domain-containing protein [Bacteroidetes bacterium]|nr:MAG: DUF4292 domain-containing protein [Bacteroidota bacterium]REK04689.1 MAG: DUF4292 domain-containing protein [Bacteroidota bacterium]REK36164.1 MAG: DUF4292 domain-containing protein [Bacteroidota bacterium]REK51465.1 MAG: DUF4292 domain-containing protein [Bacteroidota bacterium]